MAEKTIHKPKVSTEVKEKFFAAAPREEPKESGPPLYLIGLILVLIALLGVVAFIALGKQPTNVPDTNTTDTNYRTVPVTIIYSANCKNCLQGNTIEALLQVRQIPYSTEKIEAGSPEGKTAIAKYGLTTLPTALVSAEKVAFYPTTKTNFDGVFKKQENVYIVPELNLDGKAYYPVYYIDKVGGLCDANKQTIVQFDDYYTPQNSYNRRTLYNFMRDFNSYFNMKYVYTQTQYSKDNNAIMGNIFLMCASQQGKYAQLERSITGIYCNNPFKGDPTVLADPEINGCWTISDHYGTPLKQSELDVALGRTSGIDLNAFKECVAQKDFQFKNAQSLTSDLGINRAGTFLLNCQETAGIATLQDTYCAMNGTNPLCVVKSADTNSAA